jgi:hypothetical protein
MPAIIRALSRRDTILLLLGAFSMHILTYLVHLDHPTITISSLSSFSSFPLSSHFPPSPHKNDDIQPWSKQAPPGTLAESVAHFPETSIISHAPGWTLYSNIYMANGTLFIVSSTPHNFPEPRYMVSTPLEALNTPENIAAREPTKQIMDIILPEEAWKYWGGNVHRGERNRVWSVEGNSVSIYI